jgi:hypothetical protein
VELLGAISVLHAVLRDQLGPGDVRRVLRWLDRFARFPTTSGAQGLSLVPWFFQD